MNTLPANRTLNSFNTPGNRRSSISALRYGRSTSLYFPNNDTDEESRSQLLTNETVPDSRRSETLGRNSHLTPTSRNLTNPLFDSTGSLEQPWSRGYGQTVVLTPPKINLPSDHETVSVMHDFAHQQPQQQQQQQQQQQHQQLPLPLHQQPQQQQLPLRMTTMPRSPHTTHSMYSTVPMTSRPKSNSSKTNRKEVCPGCFCGGQNESNVNLYSSADELEALDDLEKSDQNTQLQPWNTCLLIAFAMLDLLLLFILAMIVFFLNWTNWIPLYHRKFRCPALPPGQWDMKSTPSDELLQPFLERLNLRIQTTPAYPTTTPPVPINPLQPYLNPNQPNLSPGVHQPGSSVKLDPSIWDADLGLMSPPKLLNLKSSDPYGVPFGRKSEQLYGPNTQSPNWISDPKWSDPWYRFDKSALQQHVQTGSVITGCIIVPTLFMLGSEIAFYFLNCCQVCLRRHTARTWQSRRLIGRLYRLIVTYIFGLFTLMLLVNIIKLAVGRLRPDFIQTCRPSSTVCPHWSALLDKFDPVMANRQPNPLENDPRLWDLLLARLASQGRYVIQVATTPAPPGQSDLIKSDGFLGNTDCTENNILRLKDARTSFPSMTATVSLYASTFLAIYVSKLLNNFRNTCLCVPFVLLLGICLVSLYLGINQVIYRQNWLEDVLFGWLLGICIAFFVSIRALPNKNRSKEITNFDLNRRLQRIYQMLQTNHEYKQSEMKMMKYL